MKRHKTAIVIQARMGSTRLPGKVMARIGGMSILGHCLTRLSARDVAPVVVATTTADEDLPVVEEARRYHAGVVRGPRADVLARYVLAADVLGLDYLVRATADNPAVDLDAPGRVLRALRRHHADYAIDRWLPYGAAVEAIRVDALRQAAARATAPADREHVTTYLRRHPSLCRVWQVDPPAELRRPDLRLTVDTGADLEYMRRLFEGLDAATTAPLADIIRTADLLGRSAEAA